jgi:hypothetical protein
MISIQAPRNRIKFFRPSRFNSNMKTHIFKSPSYTFDVSSLYA